MNLPPALGFERWGRGSLLLGNPTGRATRWESVSETQKGTKETERRGSRGGAEPRRNRRLGREMTLGRSLGFES